MEDDIHLDVLIVGGGIAGLWTLDHLRNAGRSAWLIEATALGAGQTIQSQGIIHGGLKYALGGRATEASAAIADMPLRWSEALGATLASATKRSDRCLLWSTGGLGRLGLAGASLGLRAPPRPAQSIPTCLSDAPRPVLEVPEVVLEPSSVLAAFARAHDDAILRCDGPQGLHLEGSPNSIKATVTADGETLIISADRILLCAGAGNGPLRESLGLDAAAMQIRPLRMVIARGDLPDLNGHVIRGTAPWMTITSTISGTGDRIWQIGGDVAERGASMTAQATVDLARAQLARALPGLNLDAVELGVYSAPRAEQRTRGTRRPGIPGVIEDGPVLTAWPTKLALAPLMADDIARRLPPSCHEQIPVPAALPRPTPAPAPWENDHAWNSDHWAQAH